MKLRPTIKRKVIAQLKAKPAPVIKKRVVAIKKIPVKVTKNPDWKEKPAIVRKETRKPRAPRKKTTIVKNKAPEPPPKAHAIVKYDPRAAKKYSEYIGLTQLDVKDLNLIQDYVSNPGQFRDVIADAFARRKQVTLGITFEVKVKNSSGKIGNNYFINFTKRYILKDSDIDLLLKTIYDEFTHRIEQMELNGSDMIFDGLQAIHIFVSDFKPAKGAGYVKLPDRIANTKSTINIFNKDNQCFKYAVVLAYGYMKNLFPKTMKRFDRVNDIMDPKLKIYEMLDFDGVNYPASIEDVRHFENNNDDIVINIYQVNDDEETNILPYDISQKHMTLKSTIMGFLLTFSIF